MVFHTEPKEELDLPCVRDLGLLSTTCGKVDSPVPLPQELCFIQNLKNDLIYHASETLSFHIPRMVKLDQHVPLPQELVDH